MSFCLFVLVRSHLRIVYDAPDPVGQGQDGMALKKGTYVFVVHSIYFCHLRWLP